MKLRDSNGRARKTDARPERRPSLPGDGLLHPVALAALAVLILNDHWWKRAHPSAITGKLSDVAGLIFFPILLEALAEIGWWCLRRRGALPRHVLLSATLATAIVFTLAKTWPPMNGAVKYVDALLRWPPRAIVAALDHRPSPPLVRPSMVLDATDLFALPALAMSFLVGRARHQRDHGRV